MIQKKEIRNFDTPNIVENLQITTFIMNKYFFIAITALLFSNYLIAQTEDDYVPMRVVHCTAVNQSVPVQNIHVDENNLKWVGNNQGLYKINSADNSNIYDLDNTIGPYYANVVGIKISF